MRFQSANERASAPVSVEFLGVPRSTGHGIAPQNTGQELSFDEPLSTILEQAKGSFVVWVPQPDRADSATTAVELFAQRRSLPRFSEKISADQQAAKDDGQASTSVTDLQTEVLTQVYDSDTCVVLRNRIYSLPGPTRHHTATPWGDLRRDSRIIASHKAVVQARQSSDRPEARSTPRLRPLLLAVIACGVGWFFWGSGSSMTAAIGPAVQEAPVVENSGSSGDDSSDDAPGPENSKRQRPNGTTSSNDARASRRQLTDDAATSKPNQPRDAAPGGGTGNLDQSPVAVEQRLLRDATYLASDDLEGRGVRTQGLERAAEYLAAQFAEAGLNTSHYNGTPFQEFELLSLGGDSPVQQIEFRAEDGLARRLLPDQDFASLVLSRSTKLDVPVAFAGFGISAPEVGYDDYQGLDVAGRAVVILRHAPTVFETEAGDLAKHSYIRTKIAGASARGASAVILCSDLASIESPRQTTPQQQTARSSGQRDKLLHVELTLEDGIRPLPVIHCRREILKELLKDFCKFDLDAAERRIADHNMPASQQLAGLSLAGHVSQLRRGRTLKNVVATLDPLEPTTDETIIVGAHYDHLGRGGWGSLTLGANNEIHNGADDNASGTSVLLEVARQLAATETPLPRRVLFVAFSAEELGLIGSRKYVKAPLVPIDQSIAMLNLDMVGRLRNDRLTVYGTGSSKSWSPLLDAFAPRHSLSIASKPSGYGPSDHASFYETGVPVLHFFTGFHPQYHRPEDDVEHLNVEGMRRIAGLVVDLVTTLGQAEERPQRSLASSGSPLSDLTLGLTDLTTPDVSSGPPTLGIIPVSRAQGQAGVLVRKTVSRSPADLHGIRTGDVIVRVGRQRIDSIEQLVTEVRAQSRDEKLPVELVRNGIRMKVRIQF